MLGAGGAARAIAYTMAKEADELAVLNRTVKQAQALAKLLEKTANKRIVAGSLSPKDIQAEPARLRHPNQRHLSWNETKAQTKALYRLNCYGQTCSVMDIVYNPLETKLAKDAKAAGAKVVSGVEMLIYQGAASFEIWTGKSAPVEVMRQAALNHLAEGVNCDG